MTDVIEPGPRGRRRVRGRLRPGAIAGRTAAARPAPAGLQVVRRADERRVRWRDQRRRRTEWLGQEQPRRRAPLGARRAGPRAALAQGGGRHLGRLREAIRPGHGRRHARARQRGRPAPGRLPGPGARPAAVPQRRERVPAEQAAHPAARPRRPARWRASCRQRLPVHRPGHGRPGAGPAARRNAARCSRRWPGSAGTSVAGARPRSS